MAQIQSYNSVLARVRAAQGQIKAAYHSLPSEKDPTEKGTESVPTDPNASASAQNLPENRKENAKAPANPVLDELHPGPSGTDVPSTTDGKPKDEAFTSPTTDLSKIAATAARITALQAQARKNAAATAAPASATTKAAADALATPAGINDDMLRKLAATILEDEEGAAFAEAILVKRAGVESARAIMVEAQGQYLQERKQAEAQNEWQKQASAQEAQQLAIAEELIKNASVEEREMIVKIANTHAVTLAGIPDGIEKLAYQQGAGDAAAMEDSGPAGAAGDPAAPAGDPSAGGQLPGGGEGPASMEEIAQVIMQAVQAGEIPQQDAEQIMQIIAQDMQGGGGAPGGAGAPPAGGAAGAPEAPGGPAGGPAMPPGGDLGGGESSEPAEKAASLCRELLGFR